MSAILKGRSTCLLGFLAGVLAGGLCSFGFWRFIPRYWAADQYVLTRPVDVFDRSGRAVGTLHAGTIFFSNTRLGCNPDIGWPVYIGVFFADEAMGCEAAELCPDQPWHAVAGALSIWRLSENVVAPLKPRLQKELADLVKEGPKGADS